MHTQLYFFLFPIDHFHYFDSLFVMFFFQGTRHQTIIYHRPLLEIPVDIPLAKQVTVTTRTITVTTTDMDMIMKW